MEKELTNKNYFYGARCKSNDHHDSTGQNIRAANGGKCWACHLGFPPGLFDREPKVNTCIKGKSPEEVEAIKAASKKGQSEASMRWGKKNRDKQKVIRTRYRAKMKEPKQ